MERDTFNKLWSPCCQLWQASEILSPDGTVRLHVSDLCALRANAEDAVYNEYAHLKKITKDIYFKDTCKSLYLNRYKRAAVLTYAVILADPLEYKQKAPEELLDKYFLKQRLAFYVALQSIIQDYKEEEVQKKLKQGETVFDFDSLGRIEREKFDDDDFEMSVYKDLLFSEMHRNYNVLTMANVYGLLTERASVLGELKAKE